VRLILLDEALSKLARWVSRWEGFCEVDPARVAGVTGCTSYPAVCQKVCPAFPHPIMRFPFHFVSFRIHCFVTPLVNACCWKSFLQITWILRY